MSKVLIVNEPSTLKKIVGWIYYIFFNLAVRLEINRKTGNYKRRIKFDRWFLVIGSSMGSITGIWKALVALQQSTWGPALISLAISYLLTGAVFTFWMNKGARDWSELTGDVLIVFAGAFTATVSAFLITYLF